MYILSPESLRKLIGVKATLADVAKAAIQITPQDFAIVYGLRTLADERTAIATGHSQLTNPLDSKHLPQADGFGWALDFAVFFQGALNWDIVTLEGQKRYHAVADSFSLAAKAKGVAIRRGIDWHKPDWGHIELV